MLGIPNSVIIAVPAVVVAFLLSILFIWLLMSKEARKHHSNLDKPFSGKRFSIDDENGWRAPSSANNDPLQFYYYTDPSVLSPSIATPPPAYTSKLNSPNPEYSFLPPGSSLWSTNADSQTIQSRPSLALSSPPAASPALQNEGLFHSPTRSPEVRPALYAAPKPAHTSHVRRPAYPVSPPEGFDERSPTLSLRTSFGFSSTHSPPRKHHPVTPLTADAYPEGEPRRGILRTQRPRRQDFTKAWLSSIPNDAFDRLQAEHSGSNACILDTSSRTAAVHKASPSTQGIIPLGPSAHVNLQVPRTARHRHHVRKE